MSKYIYFDNSALQRLIEDYGDNLDNVLSVNRYSLCISTHNIYEFARCFMHSKTAERGRGIFRILSSINNPRYILTPDIIIKKEKFRSESGGAYHVGGTDGLNNAAMKEGILKLSKGPDKESNMFIKERENRIAINHPKISELNVKELKKIGRGIKTFDEFKKIMLGTLCKYYSRKYKLLNIDSMMSKPKIYGYISTLINCQLYILWINYKERKTARSDKLDDYRHLINGSYHLVDMFVTADKRLLKNIPIINSSLTFADYDGFIKSMHP